MHVLDYKLACLVDLFEVEPVLRISYFIIQALTKLLFV